MHSQTLPTASQCHAAPECVQGWDLCCGVTLTGGPREAGEVRAPVSGHPILLNCAQRRPGQVWVGFPGPERAPSPSQGRDRSRGALGSHVES